LLPLGPGIYEPLADKHKLPGFVGGDHAAWRVPHVIN
jgi:hypothetical protein